MTHRFRHLIRPLVALFALALGGCIDSREEVWIERDGSGRAEIRVEIPSAATTLHGGPDGLRELVESFIDGGSGIETDSITISTADARTTVAVAIRFESALKASEVMEGEAIDQLPTAAQSFVGTARTRIHGLTLDFNRTIDPGAALPGATLLPGKPWQGHALEYIIHLPVAAKSSNATRTENDGCTLVWDIPLADAVRAPFSTRFEMDLPIPWSTVSAVAIPLSLAGGWLLLRRIRKPAAPGGSKS